MKKEKNEKPILFSSAMVRAILDGNKTQTRRVINKVPSHYEFSAKLSSVENLYRFWCKDELKPGIDNRSSGIIDVKCRYGKIGDRLWVRETWAKDFSIHVSHNGLLYKATALTDNRNGRKEWATCDEKGNWFDYYNRPIKWKPSIFMPRWASRITLEIKNIRVERLQDISETDAEIEGINLIDFNCWENYLVTKDWFYEGRNQREYHALQDSKMSFASLWDSINEKRGFGWEANPYVFVIEFKKV